MAGVIGGMVAVVPARSGSQGLPGKNVRDLCGKPMMAYSIEAAIWSGQFERVLVSTDSKSYGEIAERYGAEAVYRGPELSGSDATTFMVLEDLLGRLSPTPSAFALLQPTSPLRTAEQVAEAVEGFATRSSEFDFLASVSRAEHPRSLVGPLDARGGLSALDADFSSYRRQSCIEYVPNGAIFIAKTREYLEQGHFFGARSLAYVMDRESSVDVDDVLDFELAEICMRRRTVGRP